MPANHHRIFFYGLLLVLGLIQASLTELLDDEAYYWVYSRFPGWGYFDHPPMIAWLIKAGYALFPNELGVRLFPLLLNILTPVLIEKLIRPKNYFLFYTIVLSIAAMQLMGFSAVPDIPLLFFTALFFCCYKNFLAQASLKNTLFLGATAALLLYSKYHGVLILFFTLLSNPRLLKNSRAWLAGCTALLLFLPHLWWQYQHHWISFRYQLFESNVNPYQPAYTWQYILGQILLPGPLAGLILLPAAFLYKPADLLERSLKYTLLGIYLFFLVSSFRGKVEANWTLPVLVCLVILGYRFLENRDGWKKWLRAQLPVTLALVVLARIAMIADFLPLTVIKERYHSWHKWPAEMKVITKGLPVVFGASYQRASKYWFYTGQTSFSLNEYKERGNNFNLWPLEDSLLGKPVYYLDKYDLQLLDDSVQTAIGRVGYRFDSSFASFSRVRIEAEKESYLVKEGETVSITCRVIVPPHYSAFIRSRPGLKTNLRLAIFDRYGWIKDIPLNRRIDELVNNPSFTITADPQLATGHYYFLFAIQAEPYRPTPNSIKIKLKVR